MRAPSGMCQPRRPLFFLRTQEAEGVAAGRVITAAVRHRSAAFSRALPLSRGWGLGQAVGRRAVGPCRTTR